MIRMPHNLVETAIKMAVQAFNGKVHRDGFPAVNHSLRVGLAQTSPVAQIVGYLHDVIEDCGEIWEDHISRQFGVDVMMKVLTLTKKPQETYDEYIDRVMGDHVCMLVKVADIEDNMHPRRSDEKARAKAVTYGRAYDRLTARLSSGQN